MNLIIAVFRPMRQYIIVAAVGNVKETSTEVPPSTEPFLGYM